MKIDIASLVTSYAPSSDPDDPFIRVVTSELELAAEDAVSRLDAFARGSVALARSMGTPYVVVSWRGPDDGSFELCRVSAFTREQGITLALERLRKGGWHSHVLQCCSDPAKGWNATVSADGGIVNF